MTPEGARISRLLKENASQWKYRQLFLEHQFRHPGGIKVFYSKKLKVLGCPTQLTPEDIQTIAALVKSMIADRTNKRRTRLIRRFLNDKSKL
jgi:hypothetical protein